MGLDVHAGRVEPDEERLVSLVALVDEVHCAGQELLVHRLHALFGQRAGVLDGLLAHPAKARILGGIVLVRREGVQDAARAEPRLEIGILGRLRIVGILRLFLGVQVVEIAEELVEAVDGGQKLVAVAQMVLAELAGGVAERLEQFGERRVLVGQSFLGARQADLEQAGAEAALPGDECGASGGAGLLGVEVGEDRALFGDAVDVGRAVAHHAAVVGADVPVADVVTEDDEDVGPPAAGWRGLLGLSSTLTAARRQGRCGQQRAAAEQEIAPLQAPLFCGVPSWDLSFTRSSLMASSSLMMQRKPTWLIDVSIGCAWRAAGR